MTTSETTARFAPSDVFPVALPSGEQGTIFLRVMMEATLPGATPESPAYVGPFETVRDAADVGDRIIARPAAKFFEVVESIDPEVLYFPVDRAFMKTENVVEAIEYSLYQAKATLATGDFEQWRDKPDAAAAFLGWSTRTERAARDEQEAKERAARVLAANVAAYRRVKSMLDSGEITQDDIDAAG